MPIWIVFCFTDDCDIFRHILFDEKWHICCSLIYSIFNEFRGLHIGYDAQFNRSRDVTADERACNKVIWQSITSTSHGKTLRTWLLIQTTHEFMLMRTEVVMFSYNGTGGKHPSKCFSIIESYGYTTYTTVYLHLPFYPMHRCTCNWVDGPEIVWIFHAPANRVVVFGCNSL